MALHPNLALAYLISKVKLEWIPGPMLGIISTYLKVSVAKNLTSRGETHGMALTEFLLKVDLWLLTAVIANAGEEFQVDVPACCKVLAFVLC